MLDEADELHSGTYTRFAKERRKRQGRLRKDECMVKPEAFLIFKARLIVIRKNACPNTGC